MAIWFDAEIVDTYRDIRESLLRWRDDTTATCDPWGGNSYYETTDTCNWLVGLRYPQRREPKKTPKSWRWYDVFRTWEEPDSRPRHLPLLTRYWKTQERLCRKQRKQEKRRQWLQRL